MYCLDRNGISLVEKAALYKDSLDRKVEEKYFYIWDLDWHRQNGRDFEYTIQAYNNPQLNLIARSSSHAKAIKNYCNRDVCGVVDNFNIDQLMGVINNE